MKNTIIFGVLAFVLFIVASSSVYIVSEDEVAVVKTLGEIVSVVVNPGDSDAVLNNYSGTEQSAVKVSDQKGLHLKIPFIQTVEKYTAKYLTYTSLPESVNTLDSRKVEVQMYAQYRVIDPATFNAKVASKSEANKRMDEDVYPTIINSVNKLEFNEFFDQDLLENLLDEKQGVLNERIVKEFGIYVSDVGISRKTFPISNISTIEEKMTKEIEKDSAQSIAEGDSEYNQKTAQVDARKAQVIADAVEAAAIIMAEADAIAIRTYQESLAVDLEFYQFIQRMEIYKEINGSRIFLDQSNAIFKYLNDIEGIGQAEGVTE